jgi:hypothetical protein
MALSVYLGASDTVDLNDLSKIVCRFGKRLQDWNVHVRHGLLFPHSFVCSLVPLNSTGKGTVIGGSEEGSRVRVDVEAGSRLGERPGNIG